MAFQDWFIARARTSSKPHKKVTLDDKMVFFQQLGTLVASGTPLLQAVGICAEQSQSIKLRNVLRADSHHALPRAVPFMRRRPITPRSSNITGSRSFAPAK